MQSGAALLVLLAPDIEQGSATTDTDLQGLLSSILTHARDGQVPTVFALSRRRIGQVSMHAACCCVVSCVMMTCA